MEPERRGGKKTLTGSMKRGYEAQVFAVLCRARRAQATLNLCKDQGPV